MQKRKLLSIIAAALVGIMVLSGCSSKPASSSQGASSAPNKEPITLNIMSTLVTEAEGPAEKAMADAYTKAHPNVKINFIGVPVNDMSKKLVALNSSGDLPDAFFMPTEFMAPAISMGLIKDVKTLLDKQFLDSLNPGIVEASSIDGFLTFVPWHVIPVGLVYRQDWLKDAGLTSLETWDDFTKAAKAFTKDKNGDGKTDQWGFSMVGTRNGSGENRMLAMARTFDMNEAKKENGKWVSELTSDNFKKALTFFTDLALKDGVVPPGPTETGYPEASALFAQEKTGLMITGSNAIGAILGANANLKGKLASVAVPQDKKHLTNLQASGYAISKSAKNVDVLVDYLKFMDSKENAVSFATKFGRLPVTKEASSDPAFNDPAFKGFIDAEKYAMAPPSYPANGELIDAVGEAYTTMIANKVSLDQAMKTLGDKVKASLDKTNSSK
jgi:multiple sugar transport system substrate-binding protein